MFLQIPLPVKRALRSYLYRHRYAYVLTDSFADCENTGFRRFIGLIYLKVCDSILSLTFLCYCSIKRRPELFSKSENTVNIFIPFTHALPVELPSIKPDIY